MRRRYPRLKAKIPVELRCPNAALMRTATDEVSLCACYTETMFTIDSQWTGQESNLHLRVRAQRGKAPSTLTAMLRYTTGPKPARTVALANNRAQ
jgi:hypothetical protein